MPQIVDHLKPDGVAYVCCGTKLLLLLLGSWCLEHKVHFASFLVWDKLRAPLSWERYRAQHENIIYCGPGSIRTAPTGGSRWYGSNNETTLWQIPVDSNNEREHPTQKPVALVAKALGNSTVQDELVADPFLGSGTTL